MSDDDRIVTMQVWKTPFGQTYHGAECPDLLRYTTEQQSQHHDTPLASAKDQRLRPCTKCVSKGRLR
jgi:hypothetical protein